MSFDAFMTAAVANELDEELRGARVEKVLQPSRDEIILLLHRETHHYRLLMSASPSAPRFGMTEEAPENPLTPPVFCMLMRKHITGARVISVAQLGLERAVKLTIETYDEMGFLTERYVICEIMGRYSNILLCEGVNAVIPRKTSDAAMKIIACARPVDLTTSSKRQLLPGLFYELPPAQDKLDPFEVTRSQLLSLFDAISPDAPFAPNAASLLLQSFRGFSPLLSKELAYRADTAEVEHQLKLAALADAFENMLDAVNSRKFLPTLICAADGTPTELSCFDITCYDGSFIVTHPKSFSELTDAFFAKRERIARERGRAASTAKLLTNLEARLQKKLKAQKNELAEAENGENYRSQGDLIIANLHTIKRGQTDVELTDYTDYRDDGSYGTVKLRLDARLSPAQYAQKLYKKYARSKNAKLHLTEQLRRGEAELEYIRSVTDALSRINGQADLDGIRAELESSGYIKTPSNSPNGTVDPRKKHKAPPQRPLKKYVTSAKGYTVLVGRNNIENDRITFKTATKNDIWFHVKNVPGSHTVLLLGGNEPTHEDILEAAELAARNSSAAGQTKVCVDYTRVKNVKKPSGAKPGYVIYTEYKQLIVSAEEPSPPRG